MSTQVSNAPKGEVKPALVMARPSFFARLKQWFRRLTGKKKDEMEIYPLF